MMKFTHQTNTSKLNGVIYKKKHYISIEIFAFLAKNTSLLYNNKNNSKYFTLLYILISTIYDI